MRPRGADTDDVTFRRHAWVAQIDVAVPTREIGPGAAADRDVTVAGGHAEKGGAAEGRVEGAGVLFWSAAPSRAVLSTPVVLFWSAEAPLAVLPEPVVLLRKGGGAAGGVVDAGHGHIASILAKKGVGRTEVVYEKMTVFQDVTSGGRGIRERQVADDVIRPRRPSWAQRPRGARWPPWVPAAPVGPYLWAWRAVSAPGRELGPVPGCSQSAGCWC